MMICMRTVRGFGCGNDMASDPREKIHPMEVAVAKTHTLEVRRNFIETFSILVDIFYPSVGTVLSKEGFFNRYGCLRQLCTLHENPARSIRVRAGADDSVGQREVLFCSAMCSSVGTVG